VSVKHLLVLLAVLVVVGVVAFAPAAPTAAQGLTCTWTNIGSSTKDLFHTASAFDPDDNKMYVYSGVGDPITVTVNSVLVGDLSGANLRATWGSVAAGNAKNLVGVAGAFRAKGKGADDSAAYFFGGMNDPSDGRGGSDVQRYLVKAGRWETLTPANSSEFGARSFAAAAYDPVHDVIWVVGGISTCSLGTVMSGGSCPARPISTNYLSFDAQGNATWHTLANGNQSMFAHSMVYDAPRTRMLIYGGTSNISTGLGDVVALNLADADPSKAAFANVATTGTGPSTYFHGGAFMATPNWMVAYGGVRRNLMQSNEAPETNTYALDVSQTPAKWTDIKPSGSPGTRVAGVMEYDPLHKAAIFAHGRDKSDGNLATKERIFRTTFALTCQAAVATNTPPSGGATNTPPPGGGTPKPPTPAPVTPIPNPQTCNFILSRVPGNVINDAMANKSSVAGYDMLCNPKLPASNWNVKREYLSLMAPSKPFHPIYNTVIWKCGCP
jgi:hypothetical protein